jgi:transposase
MASIALKKPERNRDRSTRNTVKKHLKAGTVEPKFAISERPSKLDAFAEKLAGWLKSEAGKSRKQRRTLKQLHAELVALGFTGSYSRVAAFARNWRADRQREQQTTGRGTFVPLAFRPGEAFQFDWGEDYALLGGERTKLQVALIKLSHCRAFLVRAYLLQTHEMLFDAHWHGFRVFGGVPDRGIYDNMKTADDHACHCSLLFWLLNQRRSAVGKRIGGREKNGTAPSLTCR